VATSYNIGRVGSTLSPLLIGIAATRYSIGFGLGLLGISYAVCAFIPGMFIPEKMYNPNEMDSSPADRVEPSTAGAVPRVGRG
jgi:AAHS family cis,cis-muconate transporter-like MFS transporter